MKTGKRDSTRANRGNGDENLNLRSLRFLLLKSDGKPELREYKCVYLLNDEEIRLFSDEVVVNCAP